MRYRSYLKKFWIERRIFQIKDFDLVQVVSIVFTIKWAQTAFDFDPSTATFAFINCKRKFCFSIPYIIFIDIFHSLPFLILYNIYVTYDRVHVTIFSFSSISIWYSKQYYDSKFKRVRCSWGIEIPKIHESCTC